MIKKIKVFFQRLIQQPISSELKDLGDKASAINAIWRLIIMFFSTIPYATDFLLFCGLSTYRIFFSKDITPVDQLMPYTNQYLPEQDYYQAVSKEEIKEITSEFLKFDEQLSKVSFTFFNVDSQLFNIENKTDLSLEQLSTAKEEYLKQIELALIGKSSQSIDAEIKSLKNMYTVFINIEQYRK